jgi:hypothetical protein
VTRAAAFSAIATVHTLMHSRVLPTFWACVLWTGVIKLCGVLGVVTDPRIVRGWSISSTQEWASGRRDEHAVHRNRFCG